MPGEEEEGEKIKMGHWEGNWYVKNNGRIDWDKTNDRALKTWPKHKPTGMQGVETISDAEFKRIRDKEIGFEMRRLGLKVKK